MPIDVAGRTYIIEFSAMQQVCSTCTLCVQCILDIACTNVYTCTLLYNNYAFCCQKS